MPYRFRLKVGYAASSEDAVKYAVKIYHLMLFHLIYIIALYLIHQYELEKVFRFPQFLNISLISV